MLGVAGFGLALVVGLLGAAWARRGREPADDDPKPGERAGWMVVIGLGIVMPVAVVASLFVVADIFMISTTQAPAAGSTSLTVDVVAHQWWWEVRYPGTGAVTANEIHIPTGTRVNLVATTADVIHSFWVPELNRKVDTIPGQRNRILLYADRPGVYRGQCTEFCGLQHAHMALDVVAQTPAAFTRWLAGERRLPHARERARAPRTGAVPRRAVPELPHAPRHARLGPRRARPDPRRQPQHARGADDPEHAGGALEVDRPVAVDQAGQPDAGLRLPARAAARARRLPREPEVVETAVPAPTPAEEVVDRLERMWRARPGLLGWLTTTDHKRIGLLYFWTTLAFFGAGGAEAMLVRTQLAGPNRRSSRRAPTTRSSRSTG